MFKFDRQSWGRQVITTPDALAVAVALEPDTVRRVEVHRVQVEWQNSTRAAMP